MMMMTTKLQNLQTKRLLKREHRPRAMKKVIPLKKEVLLTQRERLGLNNLVEKLKRSQKKKLRKKKLKKKQIQLKKETKHQKVNQEKQRRLKLQDQNHLLDLVVVQDIMHLKSQEELMFNNLHTPRKKELKFLTLHSQLWEMVPKSTL